MQDYKEIVSKYKPTKQTVLSIIFVILALFLAAFAASGFELDLDFYKKPEFWTQTLISYAVMIFSYTIFRKTTIQSEMRNKQSNFFKSKSRYDNYIKIVRNKHLEHIVEQAVEKENEFRRKRACQTKLDKITYNLRYEELEEFSDYDLEQYCIKYRLSKREKKRLNKAIKAAMNSRVKFDKLTANDILVFSDKNSISEEADYKVNNAKMELYETIRKTFTFIVSTAIMNSLGWKGVGPEFWLMLLTHATLITSSIITAIFSGYSRINLLTTILDNRCGFLNVALADELKSNNHQLDL